MVICQQIGQLRKNGQISRHIWLAKMGVKKNLTRPSTRSKMESVINKTPFVPWWLSGRESTCQRRIQGLDLCSGRPHMLQSN